MNVLAQSTARALVERIAHGAPVYYIAGKIDKFAVEAKQGGSIVLTIRVGTSDIDAERLGWLGMHNGESIWIMLTAPEKKAEAIDGTGAEFAADHPEANPTDLFAGSDIEDDEDAGPELEDRLANALASKDALESVGSPFGSREAELQAEAAAGAGTRTARGRAATKKALADGLAAAKAAGTVQ